MFLSTMLLLSIGMISPLVGAAAQEETPPASSGSTYSAWAVSIKGESQGQSFDRQGLLIITHQPIATEGTTNGANPFEVFLISGNPGASPESGAIWLTTNTALADSRAQLDMAFVSFDASTQIITIQPDPDISATGLNGFNAYSGLVAQLYQIFGGAMQVQSQDQFQTITGSIEILGTTSLFHSDTLYSAQLNGTYIGDGVL